MSKESIDLIIIDPQIDFCRPGADANDPKRGALYVDNAENDMENVATMIDRFGSKIKNIHVTLDCHHLIDISHPLMWRNSEGKNPDPFTIISNEDVINGVWFPIYQKFPLLDPETGTDIDARKYVKEYTKKLKESGRFPLCIWNPHCLIGSDGNGVLPVLFNSLKCWEETCRKNVNYVSKGSNPFTEHYSAIKAEVPDPGDPTTQINTPLIKTWEEADKLLWAGEALSHCLKSTMEDAVEVSGGDVYLQKVTLLTDGTSPVQSPVVDFPAIADQFVKDMKNRGMKTALTTDF